MSQAPQQPQTLLVTNDFGPRAGGIETFVIGLLERLPKGEVIVYTSRQDETDEYDRAWLRDFGVRVVRDRSRILLPTPRVIFRLRNLIREQGITRIWFGAAAPLGIASRWLRIARVNRIIALTHGHEVWWAKLWPFNWLLRESAKNIDYFTYLGDFTAAAISRAIPREKLVQIAPGIDTSNFTPRDSQRLRAELGIEARPTIVSVGRLVHRKGQDRLVEALPKIKAAIPQVALVFIGEGPHRGVLDKLIKRHCLEDDVFFLGRIEYSKLAEYISVGDVFAMPSRSRLFGLEVEGLGIVYLEASATGLPVLAGDSGGAPDAVLEGETGLVVDGNDIEAISTSLIRMLQDRELQKKMSERGREWVVENWRWSIWSERFNSLLLQ